MQTKALFFDWFDTLVHYEPPRHQLYAQSLSELGISVSLKELLIGILAADKYFLEENARSPISERGPQEQAEAYMRYQATVLAGAGIKGEKELVIKLLKKMQPALQALNLVLFDDVLPTLKLFRERKLVLGLLTNASKNIISLQSRLGLDNYLDFVITSPEVGADKPDPAIFLAALKRAEVSAAEAIHVGDHYQVDILGARYAGITPVLLDRCDLYPAVNDCIRIHSLNELPEHV